MTRTPTPVTLRLDRGLLEHPEALHLRRMRAAIWLYLVLVSRLPADADELTLDIQAVAQAMGLPEGTVRSWLGHLRKHRYVRFRRVGDSVRVAVRHLPRRPTPTEPPPKPRLFTVAKLERALDETGHRDALEPALGTHDDDVVKRALAGTLAVPTSEIRRSRTALFLYLLKKHAHE